MIDKFEVAIRDCVNWLINKNHIMDKENVEYGTFKTFWNIKTKEYFIGPLWRNCQTLGAFIAVYREEKDKTALERARLCGDWFIRNQIKSTDEFEDGLYITRPYPDTFIVIPDVMESVGPILDLYEATGDEKYFRAAFRAFKAIKRHIHPKFKAKVALHYIRQYDKMGTQSSPYWEVGIQEALFYRFYKITKDCSLLNEFKVQCDQQLKLQYSDGGFYATYGPTPYCEPRNRIIWEIQPFFLAYGGFGDEKYLKAIERGCNWLSSHQNEDGSFYHSYYPNGEPYSDMGLDPASPSCAMIIWAEYMNIVKKDTYLSNCRKAVNWLLDHQIQENPDFKGAFCLGDDVGVVDQAFAIKAYYALKNLEGWASIDD